MWSLVPRPTREEAFGRDHAPGDQMDRAAILTSADICDELDRQSNKALIRHSHPAQGSCEEVRS